VNINSLIEKCQNFNSIVIESGIQRDLQGFQTTLGQPNVNKNLIMLQDITNKVEIIIDTIYQSSIPDDMLIVLPSEKTYQFATTNYIQNINAIKDGSTLTPIEVHNQLVNLVNNIVNHINSNIQKINNLMSVLMPYYKKENDYLVKDNKAILAVIFNNDNCYKTLPELLRTIKKWNHVFSIFTQLMTSEPYKDVEIVSIHDGSVDFLFNFNIDLSINLTEIIKYGLIALSGYFLYLKKVKEITDTYQGNEKLTSMEKERKALLLENVFLSISKKLREIHQSKIDKNKEINSEAVEKKIETVSKIITEHLVEGNEVKLLSSEGETTMLPQDLKLHEQIVKKGFKTIDDEELKLLVDRHKISDDDIEKNESNE
jgi:hypothetical protein